MGKRTIQTTVAVAYIRVSTHTQKNGPEAQRRAIQLWAQANGITVATWHEDRGVSGGTAIDLRPGLTAALASMRASKAGVFLADVRDRLGRDVVEVGLLERAVTRLGGVVRTADGRSDGDQFEKDVRDVFSAHEKREIQRRILAALNNKRLKKEKLGGLAPYGCRLADDGVHLAPVPEEQAVIARVRELDAQKKTQRAIVEELALSGVVSRVGRPLQKTQVARLLARE